MSKPTIGRTIHYVLSEEDCITICRRRAHMQAIREGENQGNPVSPGDIVPAIIVRVWNQESGLINGQAFLDGYDSLWLLSRHLSEAKEPGTWHWPERV